MNVKFLVGCVAVVVGTVAGFVLCTGEEVRTGVSTTTASSTVSAGGEGGSTTGGGEGGQGGVDGQEEEQVEDLYDLENSTMCPSDPECFAEEA